MTREEMAGKVLCVDELERSRRISGAADRGAAGGELKIGAPKHGALLAVLAAADLGESSERTAGRIAGAVRSFAPAPFEDDMAIVDIQVAPATASEVAA